MILVNDSRLNSDTFWFTLFHEIGHIMNGDYGMSFDAEDSADKPTEDLFIPFDKYKVFIDKNRFGGKAICKFAEEIDRDPGIILGRFRLLNDGERVLNNSLQANRIYNSLYFFSSVTHS